MAAEAHAGGGSVYRIVFDKGLPTREQLDRILKPEDLTKQRRMQATSGVGASADEDTSLGTNLSVEADTG